MGRSILALATIAPGMTRPKGLGLRAQGYELPPLVRSLTVAFSPLPLALVLACGGHSAAPPRPNVLLVTIDTFRADRVGTGVAPAIDRLATSGIRFTAARSAVPLTLPSHTTIHTGLLSPMHGVRQNGVDVLADTHKTI